jgi:hypothetical protein
MSEFGNWKQAGRNDPCPCGSGKKFKKCHGSSTGGQFNTHEKALPHQIVKQLEQYRAAEFQRQQQQGLGDPIVSEELNGWRFVAVKGDLFAGEWQTFHEFLYDYIKKVLGSDWGNKELTKPEDERHPVLNWYQTSARYQNQFITQRGKVHFAPITGAVAAYLGLAYNLYVLAHNAELQDLLIKRLKDKNQFYGAYYKAYVAARLILAGFELEFEDETDSTTSHCELTATFRNTGKQFSVEAKMRGFAKASAEVRDQLYRALKKKANHARIVFIEANVPDAGNNEQTLATLRQVWESIRTSETELTINGQPAPPAYVVVTNNPHQYNLNTEVKTWAFAEGFKIGNFTIEPQVITLREALRNREQHLEIFCLMKSMSDHREIPATFDGDYPEFAFGQSENRLKVGNTYLIPDETGKEVPGELMDAVVVETEKVAVCIYKLADGRQIVTTSALSDNECAAYRRHPETFFGVVKKHPRKIKDPIELYDCFYDCYRNATKERLLKLMKDAVDHSELAKLSLEELARTYAERLVYSILPIR